MKSKRKVELEFDEATWQALDTLVREGKNHGHPEINSVAHIIEMVVEFHLNEVAKETLEIMEKLK